MSKRKKRPEYLIKVVKGDGVNLFISHPFAGGQCDGEELEWNGFTPRQTRALAMELLLAADQAEGRKTPGPKPKKR